MSPRIKTSTHPVLVFLALLTVSVAVVAASDDAFGTSPAAEQWMPLDGAFPQGAEPTSEVIADGLDGIVLQVRVPGLFVREIETPQGMFHDVRIPREGSLRSTGKPKLPEIVLMIAAPEFEDVAVEWETKESEQFDGLIPYPCPQEVVREGPDGPYILSVVKEFALGCA